MRCSSGCPRWRRTADSAAADSWLASVGGVSDAEVRARYRSKRVCGIIGDPAHAALFGPDSLGEAPISAVVPGGHVIAGTVDRLLVEPNRVRVVDFKTGRRVPLTLEEVPIFHLRQMAAYAEALRVIFPGRAIEAALLYTAAPRLFDLPPDLLARAQARLGRDGAKLGAKPLSKRAAATTFGVKGDSHGYRGDYRRQLSKPTCSIPTSPCWSISGPNGAARAR